MGALSGAPFVVSAAPEYERATASSIAQLGGKGARVELDAGQLIGEDLVEIGRGGESRTTAAKQVASSINWARDARIRRSALWS